MSKHKRSLGNIKITGESDEKVFRQDVVVPAAKNISKGEEVKNYSKAKTVKAYEFMVEPEKCLPWKFHNRSDVWMNSDRCKDLIDSISANGQKVPVFARRIHGSAEGKEWEIIAGRRRWFACKRLARPLRVKSFDGSDREAAILMSLENKDRDNVSEFEDALSYKQQLDAGLFVDQDDMAKALGVSKSKLSKKINATKITRFSSVFSLFDDITELKINPVYNLVCLLEKSKDNEVKARNWACRIKDKDGKKRNLRATVIISKLVEVLLKVEGKKTDPDKGWGKILRETSSTVVIEINKRSDPAQLRKQILKILNDKKLIQEEVVEDVVS